MGLGQGLGIGSVQPGVCTSTTRPSSPYVGQMIYETDTSYLRVYTSSGWSLGIFQSIGLPITYMVIAGGGGGGADMGGGGGGGGYLSSTAVLTAGTYTVTVGAGGAGSSAAYTAALSGGLSGSPSSLTGTGLTISAVGGGGGGGGHRSDNQASEAGKVGGSGGGAAGRNTNPGVGTSGQGFSGGFTGTEWNAGGGGGAGAQSTNINGGTGILNTILGSNLYWAGGGGGGGYSGASGNGGRGGGGGGGGGSAIGSGGVDALNNGAPGVGTGSTTGKGGAGGLNTGAGGGGSAHQDRNVSATGGSGIVVVRYLTERGSQFTISGGTVSFDGLFTVRSFTGTGAVSLTLAGV
jgi:fibronectin-binding autotransporter adhesin